MYFTTETLFHGAMSQAQCKGDVGVINIMHNSKIMKKFLGGVLVMIAVFLGAPAVASADASPVSIHLTIQTFDQTLFDGDILVNPCFNTQYGPTTTVNTFCAITQVASSSGWTVGALWSQYGVFVNSINTYAPISLSGPYWLYYANGESALTGLDAHVLTAGEDILLTFGISPLRVVPATTTPLIGTSTIFQVQYFDTDSLFDWVSATTSTVIVNGTPLASDANGKLSYIPISTTTVTVSAEAWGHIASKAITLYPYNDTPPQSTFEGTIIHLDIETYDGTLYDNDVTVYPCPDTQFGTSTTINAFCAVNQVASTSGWTLGTTWYSFGKSLDGINAYTSDFANNRFWIYYSGHTPAFDGLNAHVLVPHEEILLTYGIDPLRVYTATSSVHIGDNVTLQSQRFDPLLFDWVVATGTTFTVSGTATSSDAEAKIVITATSSDPIIVIATKTGSIGSLPLTITPMAFVASTPPSPSGGSPAPDVTHAIDTQKALQFLRSQANTDGSYAASLYTDWVAVGIAGISGADDMRSKLRTYMLAHTDPGSLLTDVERRAMALEALGVDPAQGTSRNYISEIVAKYDGTQFGDANQVNDDIFALIPLMHAGYAASDPEITGAANFIVSKQDSSGSWGSVDLTAAGIESLQPLTDIAGVTNAIARAKAYLHQSQQSDGGFGSSFATSWVLTAIYGIPGDQLVRDWTKNGRTPSDYLWVLQQADGGMEPTTLDANSRIWATSYALTGSNGKDWNAALAQFAKVQISAVQTGSTTRSTESGEVLGAATTTATSTMSKDGIMGTSTILTLIGSSTLSEIVILNDVSATTSATSSIAKASSTPLKSKSGKIKKKLIPKEIKKQTASVANTASSVPPAPLETKKDSKGIGSFIVDPFTRFFQFVGSWF